MVRSKKTQSRIGIILWAIVLLLFSLCIITNDVSSMSMKEDTDLVRMKGVESLPNVRKEEVETSLSNIEMINRKLNHLMDEGLLDSLSFDISNLESFDEEMIDSLLVFLEENYDVLVEHRMSGGTLEVVVEATAEGYLFTIIVKWSNGAVQVRNVGFDELVLTFEKVKFDMFVVHNQFVYGSSVLLHKHIDCVKTVVLRN